MLPPTRTMQAHWNSLDVMDAVHNNPTPQALNLLAVPGVPWVLP